MEEPLARFRCSIRLEATYRALEDQRCKQLCLLAISYVELWSIAVIPAIHLTTSDYVSFAAFFLMYGIASWRAKNFLDVFWYPVHLLRPRDYSRLGLGTQKPVKGFFMVSLLLRCSCSVAFFSSIAYYYFGRATADNPWACMYYGSDPRWFEYKRSDLNEDLSACEANPNRSSWCSSLTSFERRCGDESLWPERLRSFAQSLGLGCENTSYPRRVFRPYREAYYCEYYPEPVEVNCLGQGYGYGREGGEIIVWFENAKSSFDQVCEEWPAVPYTSYCEMLFPDLGHCAAVPNMPSLGWESVVSQSCELDSCEANVPSWFRAVSTEEERLYLCRCLSCRPFWLTNECYVDGMDSAFRRRSGAEDRNENENWLQDPRLSLQFALMMFMGAGAALWLLLSLVLWCMGRLWDLPSDLELEENIKLEEKQLREEFLAKNRIETPVWCCRLTYLQLCILAELAFYLADFVTDAEMLYLYLQRQHYGFAVLQGCIVLRSLLGQLFEQGFRGFFADVRDSLRSNLRTDRLLSVVQGERSKEATMSFLLQVYALFYMGEHNTVYWMSLISFVLSMRGIANGFVIHFDLAIVPKVERLRAVSSDPARPRAPAEEPPALELPGAEPIGRDASSFSLVMPSKDKTFAV